MIQRDPDLRMRQGHQYDLTRPEDREQTMRQIARVVEIQRQTRDERFVQALFKAMCFYSEAFSQRTYVHKALFRQALELFGTAEQQDKWLDDIINWRVYGCFSMVTTDSSTACSLFVACCPLSIIRCL
jgi:acyl-CoA oxidase